MERLKVVGVAEVSDYCGGTREASRRLKHFLKRPARPATPTSGTSPRLTTRASSRPTCISATSAP